MKNIVAAATLFCMIALVQSCSKKSQGNFIDSVQPDQLIETNVPSGQPYTFIAGPSGTLTVTRQASHFQVSQAGIDEKGLVVYSYSSSAGYVGADEVSLAYSPVAVATENNSSCSGTHTNSVASTSIKIRLNVTK